MSVRDSSEGFGSTTGIETQALLSAILAHSSEGMTFVGPDLIVRIANESFARQLGIPPHKIIGCSIEDLLPGLEGRAGNVCQGVRDTNKPWNAKAYAYEFPDQPGRGVTYWDTTISPVLGPAGAFQGWLVLHNEVTERVRLERALCDNEERYHSFFNNSPDAVLLTAPDGRILSANPAATRMFGMSEKEICRASRESLMDASDPRLAIALEERARTGKAVAELTSRRRDGTTFPAEVSSTVFRDGSGEARTAMFIRDITERKRMESDLRMARLALDSATNPIYWMSADAHFLYVNEAAANSLGYTVDELFSMTVFEIDPAFPREQWPVLWEEMRQARSLTIESAHRRKDGTTFPVEIRLNFMEFEGREILYSFVADITERKRTEEHLAEQAALLRGQAQLLDLAHILIRDPDDRIVTWNSGANTLYGFSKEEAIGRVSHDLLQTKFPESKEAVAEALDREGHWQGELVHTAKDGRKVVVASHQVLHRDEDERPVAILEVNNDISAQKQAEMERERLLEQLQSANGRLAAESKRSRDLAAKAEATAERLASIQQVTDAALAHLALDDLLVELLRRVRQVLAADNATILLPTDDGRELVVRATSGLEEEVGAEVRVPLGHGFAGHIAASREPLIVGDPSQTEIWSAVLRDNLRSLIGVPMMIEGRLIGVLHIGTASARSFTADELQLLQLVGDRAALAIENARLLRQAHIDRARWQATVDSMLDLVAVCDARGQVTYINPAYSSHIGYLVDPKLPLEEHPKYYKLYRPDGNMFGADELPLQRAALYDEEVRAVEVVERTADGREFTGVFNAAPLHDADGRVAGAVVVGRDITEQRKAEAERERLLEDIRRRAAELDAVNKELEAFSYSVSHDLRAPLRGIDGFSQALLEEYAEQLDAQGKEYLNFVRSETHRMAELIDALLTLSRISRAEMRREDVDLSGLAQKIAGELRRAEPERQVEFVISTGLVTNGDPRLLQVALQNLLANSWKFTARHPRARIEFGAMQIDAEPVYYVRDDGAGFDMAYAGKLFGAFQRLHRQNEFSGTGIGLATVQRIINRHGGRIWAEGQVERGASFYFTL